MYLYSWNPNSEAARRLATALNARRIRHEGSRFVGSANKTVINFGSSDVGEQINRCRVINRPDMVARATNKLSFFQTMNVEGGPRVPEWTTSMEKVGEWLVQDQVVVARTVLQGHSGEGIVLLRLNDTPIRAPLYTLYKKKRDEYRIHIVNNEIVDFARKARRSDVDDVDVNWFIRNHDNGFVYVRGDVELPTDVRTQALSAMRVSGLDFGAVDVIYNHHHNMAYVLEINTAPGMEGTTVTSYANALSTLVRG